MANYINADTFYAMKKIREMFALVDELAPQIERCKQRYSQEPANQRIMELHEQYRAANHEARNAVSEAIKAAHNRVENSRADALHVGNAEEDFKLLSLPLTLSRDELRAMVKRNEGNALFARAVSQYAKDHQYDDADFRHMSTPLPFNAQHQNIDAAGQQLMRYCEEDRLDVAIANNWRVRAFNKADEMGLFETL